MRKRVTGKKAVALVMASLMIASMAGCGSSGSGSSGSGNTSVKEDGSIDTSKHEVINMLVLGNKPTNGRLEAMLDKLNPILTEKVNAELEFTGPFIGIRGSRQLKGSYVLTAEDIISCVDFDDTIACGGYPIDIHAPEGNDTQMYEKTKLSLEYGDIYHIPYRSLISDNVKNLITVGRCISANFEAQAAIRVSPIAGAIGHGGGVAAGICAVNNINVQDIDIEELRKELKKQGALYKYNERSIIFDIRYILLNIISVLPEHGKDSTVMKDSS